MEESLAVDTRDDDGYMKKKKGNKKEIEIKRLFNSLK